MTLDEEITEFLVARLDEDEAVARSQPEGNLYVLPDGMEMVDVGPGYVLALDPARVLREVEAIRRVLGHLQRLEEKVLDSNLWTVTEVEGIQKALAAIWSDHPDYDAEWSEDQ